MRIYRVDGKEQMDIPNGITIARDGKSTPIAPPKYPHKVEYIETTDATPQWTVVCDHKRNFPQELAESIHGKFDGCGWHYGNWDEPRMDPMRQRYLDKANALLSVISAEINPLAVKREEAAFELAIRILDTL